TAKYHLSVPEEKILSLKSQTSFDMWVSGNDRILNKKTVKYKGKILPIAKAMNMVQALAKTRDRKELSNIISIVLQDIASFSEAEINAIINDKKTDDELRGLIKPYESRVISCENDMKVVEDLRKIVTDNFHIAKRFYKLKAKLLKQRRLGYYDRGAKIGKIRTLFSFEGSLGIFRNTLQNIDNRFVNILDDYMKNGQVDVYPKIGKTGGAYCSGSYRRPTFVLLNHIDDLHSFTTFAHEMGHAFHTELSKSQGVLYSGYSISLAETASTLFETIALDSVFEKLSKKEQIIVLHDKINDDISTIFRQIACFNFELELHNTIREKGFIPKEEIAKIHNKNMKAYLGPLFDIREIDGYFFVAWSHIRNFFYVYTYAYGQLVSKAMLAKYYKDKSFWKSIEKFLEAGGKASPEEILEEIGIDVRSGEIWKVGLEQIDRDIERLEKLTK
ncbi:MAG TPA: M3 family metallopeptidase, partial [Candidatus Paceibacterota bacterium]